MNNFLIQNFFKKEYIKPAIMIGGIILLVLTFVIASLVFLLNAIFGWMIIPITIGVIAFVIYYIRKKIENNNINDILGGYKDLLLD